MKKTLGLALMAALLPLCAFDDSCDDKPTPVAASGVKKAEVQVAVGSDGLTAEQRNVKQRLQEDNKPGAIKHLYVISPYSGQVILYSTVRGKVTSGGKRLTPTTVAALDGSAVGYSHMGMQAEFAGDRHYTPEVLQDDGTYGSSGEYLYWWDVRGKYFQIYVNSSVAIFISDQPLPVKSVTINTEPVDEK